MQFVLMRCATLSLLFLLMAAGQARAVILYSSPTRNTSAPAGLYANSGWQYQGRWVGVNGTPIGPRHFITAGHVGGGLGSAFRYRGADYTASAYYDDPNSDLRIWKVNKSMPAWAPLWTSAGTEVGRGLTVFGRGRPRGEEVRANGVRKGWRWGAGDSAQSWGTNIVNSTVKGGAGVGSLLRFNFTPGGTIYESALATGDSGGGVFLKDGTTWKLAGVNYAVDGPFSLIGSGTGFLASLHDTGGLYAFDGSWKYITDHSYDQAGFSYATRVSTNLTWIRSVLSGSRSPDRALTTSLGVTVPEPAGALSLLLGGALLLWRRR